MMERDFLGMSGGKEDTKGSRHDAGVPFRRNRLKFCSAVRWPFINKASAMQQFMLHKAAQAERANKYRFDRLSSPTFHPVSIVDAFEADRSDFPPALAQQYRCCRRLLQWILSCRNMPKPTRTSAQLTIFYAGTVNVYDDVSVDKVCCSPNIFSFQAQAIMMLASKGSNGAASRSEAPLSVPPPVPPKISGSDGLNGKQILDPTPIRVASPSSVFSNPMPVTLHTVANSSSICNTKNDSSAGAKVAGTLAPSTQQGPPRTSSPAVGSVTSAAIVPRGICSVLKDDQVCILYLKLGRHPWRDFLKNARKVLTPCYFYRVNDAMPYSCIKKTPEIGSGPESASASSISSSADVNVSSNREHSLDLRNQKSGISCGDSLSTKLRI
ncbi:hypothetical protein GW17_00012590 [Ensete ventricosum]|nr:hypothetical protein GW17_00012590 [Ensete ventricosum]